MHPESRKSVRLWVGCVAGALEENEYRDKLASAGFEGIQVEPTRVYRVEDAREFLNGQGIDADAIAPQVDGKFMSAFIRAVKPGESGCGPGIVGQDSILRPISNRPSPGGELLSTITEQADMEIGLQVAILPHMRIRLVECTAAGLSMRSSQFS